MLLAVFALRAAIYQVFYGLLPPSPDEERDTAGHPTTRPIDHRWKIYLGERNMSDPAR